MGYLPADLPARLRTRGLTVHEHPGWQRFGSATLRPEVVVIHDDIIGGCPGSLPGIIPNGRPDLAGPLYNLWAECNGEVTVVAAGVANNAGRGSWAGFVGNSRTVGLCRSHTPYGGTFGGTAEQNAALSICAEVICDHYGLDPLQRVCGHKEWTTRKPDPWNMDMSWFRTLTALRGDDMGLSADDKALLGQWEKDTREQVIAEQRRQADQIDRYAVWDMRRQGVPDAEISRILGKKKLPAA